MKLFKYLLNLKKNQKFLKTDFISINVESIVLFGCIIKTVVKKNDDILIFELDLTKETEKIKQKKYSTSIKDLLSYSNFELVSVLEENVKQITNLSSELEILNKWFENYPEITVYTKEIETYVNNVILSDIKQVNIKKRISI